MSKEEEVLHWNTQVLSVPIRLGLPEQKFCSAKWGCRREFLGRGVGSRVEWEEEH